MNQAILEGIRLIRDMGSTAAIKCAVSHIQSEENPDLVNYWRFVYCYLRGHYDGRGN